MDKCLYKNKCRFLHTEVTEKKEEKNEPQQKECAVCLEPIKKKIVLFCGHSQFCQECIEKLLEKLCPLCKQPITGFTPLYE